MNTFKKIIFLLIITVVVFSCNNSDKHSDSNRLPKKSFFAALKKLGTKNNSDTASAVFVAYGKNFQLLMKNDQGVFRGLHFGMSPENVEKSEQTKPDENDKDYLFYTVPFDTIASDTNNYFTISYSFDERGMNEIKAEVFLISDQDAEQLADKIQGYFTKRYQQPISENDATIWTARDANYGKIKIALSDESSEYGYGKITLSFYNGNY